MLHRHARTCLCGAPVDLRAAKSFQRIPPQPTSSWRLVGGGGGGKYAVAQLFADCRNSGPDRNGWCLTWGGTQLQPLTPSPPPPPFKWSKWLKRPDHIWSQFGAEGAGNSF